MKDDISNSALPELQWQTEQLKLNVIDLTKTLDELQKKQQNLQLNFKANTQGFKENAEAIKQAEASLKDINEQIDKNTKVFKLAEGSLQQNKKLLEDLQSKYQDLSAKQGDNSKQVKDLNIQIGHLSKTIEDQENKVKKSREVFDYHGKSVSALQTAFEKVQGAAGDFGPQLGEVAKGFNFMKDGLGAVKTGFQSVDGAIKTTAFGALMLVLQSVVTYLTKTEEGGQLLSGTLAVIAKIVDRVNGYFGNMGRIIVNAVTSPVESIKAIGNAILQNLINRATAFKVILDGLIHLDFKKVGNGAIQAATGITNATDKIKAAYHDTKKAITETGTAIVSTFNQGKKVLEQNARHKKSIEEDKKQRKKDNAEHLSEIANNTEAIFKGYAKELAATEAHFNALEKKHKGSAVKLIQIHKDKTAAFEAISKKFQTDDQAKLDAYHHQLTQIALNNITDARQRAKAQLDLETEEKLAALDKDDKAVKDQITQHQTEIARLKKAGKLEEVEILQATIDLEEKILKASSDIRVAIKADRQKKEAEIDKEDVVAKSPASQLEDKEIKISEEALQKNIDNAEQQGHHSKALQLQISLLDQQHLLQIEKEKGNQEQLLKINQDYAKKKAGLEDQLTTSRIHAGDKFIDAALKNSKKDWAIYKAAFMAKKATSIADTIINTKQAIMESLKAYSGIPFIGQALGIAQAVFMGAQGASSIAEIAKQKPGFASGGQFVSDGKGALLSGYSRTDDTNAYLRSGEAVVVSEAMRNPWARNLVSAINVAHGGRDFSIANPGNGYAIGGIFTDGGNANRYYNQPMNDQKDLANTIAYQIINNFPPVYVDVKDINSQQSILAQTVNRVNL